MDNSGIIEWNGEEVAKLTNIMFDMWYIDADCELFESENCKKFKEVSSKLNVKQVFSNLTKGIVATLKMPNESNSSQHVIIMSLSEKKLFMRLVTDEIARVVNKVLLNPWKYIDNATNFENQLNKEVTFIHPLYWLKVKAIAIRTDRDDVLFELLNGRNKYAVVHLTYNRVFSRKWPFTHFYKDWSDLYQNLLLGDFKEFEDD